ncbi:MAG: TIGR04219 family outer membrane beta-barrel protein [Desulfobacteraceae bacterium]|nr:TIGR04219 family outer membrane beta-barrel protein [Desulfobacteraceae bacterium]
MGVKAVKMFLCLLAVLAVLLPFRAVALPLMDIEGAIGGWRVSPSGDMAYKSDDYLDLEDDFSFDEEDEIYGRLKINTPALVPNLYLMVTPQEYKGTGTYSKTFRFGEIDFDVSEEFNSRLTMDHYDIGVFYNIPLIRGATLNRLNLEAGVNARIIEAEAVVEQKDLDRYEKKSETLPVPMIYLGLGLHPVERFALEAEVRGISYSDYEILSMIGRVKVRAVGPVFVSGGYRHDIYDIEEDDLIIDVDFSGPFLETGVNF